MVDVKTLVDLLRLRAETDPDRRALTFLADGEQDEHALTYAALDARARAIAERLSSIARPGDRALLLHPPGLEFVTGLFGVLYAGLVAVPAHPPERGRSLRRLEAIAEDADPAVVLVTSDHETERISAALPALGRSRWVGTDSGDGADWTPPPTSGDDLAVLQYTSGSTGTPKGIGCSHTNVLHNLAYIRQVYGLSDRSVSVTWMPHYHDMGLILGLLEPLYARCHGVFMPPAAFVQKPVRLLRAITRFGATFAGGPNFCFDLCARRVTPEEQAPLDLKSWVCAYNGAEPVRAATLVRFAERFAASGFRYRSFFPCFGLGEATALVCGGQVDDDPVVCTVAGDTLEQDRAVDVPPGTAFARDLVGVGRGGFGMSVRVVDPATGLALGDDRIGEIWVQGPSVVQRYWRRPAETGHTFGARLSDTGEGPFLRTGDLGFLRGGELFVTGRLKDLVILHGANHYPQDIELTVEGCHPALRPGFTVAVAVDVDGEERLVVAQELVDPAIDGEPLDEVFAAVQRAIATEHGIEAHTIVLLRPGAIPKTSSGKVQRRECRRQYLAGELPVVAERVARRAVPAATGGSIEAWLVDRIAARNGVRPRDIAIHRTFAEHGLGSAAAVELTGALGAWLGRDVPIHLLFDHPTIAGLAAVLTRAPPVVPAGGADGGPIAIIGAACRLPGGADDLVALWRLLEAGRDAVTEVPPGRWDPDLTVRHGGFLSEIDQFDAGFFGLAPVEVVNMDPQQRLLLEVGFEALDDAGLVLDGLAGSATGVFVGLCNGDYQQLLRRDPDANDPYSGTGTSFAVASGRLSYTFGLEGPSVTVDTACSGSLVAIHLACQSLRSGESRLALAGGVNLVLTPDASIGFSKAGMLAPDGRCKAFDTAADGYGRGEGCGLVVLKRLADALADGDRVLAVIRGTAVNQDGRSNGLTAPNGRAQQAVIERALAAGGVAPAEVDYLEAHGTGTPLGDPIELGAIATVFGGTRGPPLVVGSVKTNLAHLESAAGVAGLLKVLVSLEHQSIPPHLHFRRWNERIALGETKVVIADQTVPWPRGPRPRIAGVSSFGLSGTNAHLIVEEASATETRLPDRRRYLIPISARSEAALRAVATRMAERIAGCSPAELEAVAFTASVRRSHHPHRACGVGDSAEAIAHELARFGRGAVSTVVTARPAVEPRGVVFVFSGRGWQRPAMGQGLAAEERAYREAFAAADQAIARHTSSADSDRVQGLMFAVQVGLVALWRSWGVEPAAVVGHSGGEVAAAHAAGALSLDDAARIVATRSRLVAPLRGRGRLAQVGSSEAEVLRYLDRRVSVAGVNAATSVLLAGENGALEAVVARLVADGVFARFVDADFASHSPEMDPILPELVRALSGITPRASGIPFCSTVTGDFLDGTALDAGYWARNLREPVRFLDAVTRLSTTRRDLFVELTAHPVLVPSLDPALGDGVPSLTRSPDIAVDDPRQLREALAAVYTHGATVDWRRHYPAGGEIVRLPAYPWQRERFWAAQVRQPRASAHGHPIFGEGVRWSGAPGTRVWSGQYGASRWWQDHRVGGRSVAPAAATIEGALYAARELWGPGSHTLEDVRFAELLVLPHGEEVPVQLVVTTEPAGGGFELRSRSGEHWTTHVTGTLRRATPAESAPLDLDAARARCPRPDAAFYTRAEADGIAYGSAFRGVASMSRGEGEAVARISWPPELALDPFPFHPALLDACLQVLRAALPDDAGALLPVSIGRARLLGPPRPTMWAQARGADVVVVDDRGQPIAEFQGIGLVRVEAALEERWLLQSTWVEGGSGTPGRTPGRWLVCTDGSALGEAVCAGLAESGADVVPIRSEQPLPPGPCAGIVHLRAAEGGSEDLDAAQPIDALQVGCRSVLHLVQAVLADPSVGTPRLWLVTRGTRAVDDGDPVSPVHATLHGLCRTLRHESPELRATTVDLDHAPTVGEADALLRVLRVDGDDDAVTLRAGVQRVERLAEADPAPSTPVLRPDGAYLVTGGLGALGLVTARWLVSRGARHLVLAGRNPPSIGALATIRELEALGATVTTCQGDVADPADVDRMVGLGDLPLRGVFHAAGVLDDAVLATTDWSRFEAVFRPKILGAVHLDRRTRDLPLDLFVLFSSAAGVVGSAGQAPYAAANTFLGALARHRHGLGLPALAIAWGPWSLGLAAGDDRAARLARDGIRTLSAEDGTRVLDRIVGGTSAEIVPLRLDLPVWREAAPRVAGLPVFADLGPSASTGGALLRELAALPVASRPNRLALWLREELARVLRLPAARLDAATPLGTLGLDSLMALELRNRFESVLGLRVPVSVLWGHRTVGALTAHFAGQLGLVAPASSPPREDDLRSEAQAEADLLSRLAEIEGSP